LPVPGRYLSFDINRQCFKHEGLDQVGIEGGRGKGVKEEGRKGGINYTSSLYDRMR